MTKAASGSPKVLYVDDEVLHHELFSLEFPDISTVLASTAEEALSILDADSSIAVVLMDYHLPGMSGTELAIVVARKRPDIIRLLTSGNLDNGARAALDKGLVAKIIGKPWDRQELRTYLEDAIQEYVEAKGKSLGRYAIVDESVEVREDAIQQIQSALSTARVRIGEATSCRRRIAALLKAR